MINSNIIDKENNNINTDKKKTALVNLFASEEGYFLQKETIIALTRKINKNDDVVDLSTLNFDDNFIILSVFAYNSLHELYEVSKNQLYLLISNFEKVNPDFKVNIDLKNFLSKEKSLVDFDVKIKQK